MRRHRVVLMGAPGTVHPAVSTQRSRLESCPYRYATNSIVLYLRRHLPTRILCTYIRTRVQPLSTVCFIVSRYPTRYIVLH